MNIQTYSLIYWLLLVTTVASQVEGDNLRKHKSSQYIARESSPLTSAPLKDRRSQSRSVDSIPCKQSASSGSQRNSTPSGSSYKSTGGGSDESSSSSLEYKSYKGISSNEFIELCQQLSDPNCSFSYLQ